MRIAREDGTVLCRYANLDPTAEPQNRVGRVRTGCGLIRGHRLGQRCTPPSTPVWLRPGPSCRASSQQYLRRVGRESWRWKEVAAAYETVAARGEALLGDAAEARRRATAALGLSTGRDVPFGAALALTCDAVRAQTLADHLGKRIRA